MNDLFCRKTVKFSKKIVSIIILTFFVSSQIVAPAGAQLLPAPGIAIGLTEGFQPPVLLGLKIHPENPLLFDFIVDQGASNLSQIELKSETEKLVKYFLAALTIPDKEVWVNLSPYEKDRIIPDVLGQTVMGKTMLEQDYILKQLASSLTNPNEKLGQEFWAKVKDQTKAQLGTTDVPMNTFNKVWIVPQKAEVLESNGIVIVGQKRLKLMMDQDYLAMAKNQADGIRSKDASNISNRVFKDTILPNIEKEINEGKNFANVRQIYNSVILAAWYKQALKESLLGRVYADKGKIAGVETDDKAMKQKIYDQYLAAFKKGVYNLIKEDSDAVTGDAIPRKYFSGGLSLTGEVLKRTEVGSSAIEKKLSASSGIFVVGVQAAEPSGGEIEKIRNKAATSGVTRFVGSEYDRYNLAFSAIGPILSKTLAITAQEKSLDQFSDSEKVWFYRFVANLYLAVAKDIVDIDNSDLKSDPAEIAKFGDKVISDIVSDQKRWAKAWENYEKNYVYILTTLESAPTTRIVEILKGLGLDGSRELAPALKEELIAKTKEVIPQLREMLVPVTYPDSLSLPSGAGGDLQGQSASSGILGGNIERWLTSEVAPEELNVDMFRDYDFRNTGPFLKPEMVFRLGLAWADMALEKAQKAGITNRRVLLARDARKIEPELIDALVSALRYRGLDVVYIADQGTNSVTSYSWAVQQLNPLMSIFMTASHVSQPENIIVRGFKVAMLNEKGGNIQSLSTQEIKGVSLAATRELLAHPEKIQSKRAEKLGDFTPMDITENVIRFNALVGRIAAGNGSLYELGKALKTETDPLEVLKEFETRYTSDHQPLKGMKVVVEGSHTESGKIAAATFKELGAEVVLLHGDIQEVSGEHKADPSNAENLRDLEQAIKDNGSDFGIAFDLDGDRGHIHIPVRTPGSTEVKFVGVAPDNAIVTLLPSLISNWGYNQPGMKVGVIRDVLGTFGVNNVAQKEGATTFQTDAGYVFLKALKEIQERSGFVFPIYGERSGHTWLHVSGEIENPLSVAILFATMVKKQQSADSLNSVLDVYNKNTIPYSQSPRFMPLFHPELLVKLSADPKNTTGWKFDPANPTKPPQAIIAMGRDFAVSEMQKEFTAGKVYQTPAGALTVKEFNSYQDTPQEGGLFRFADVVFELNGQFAGRFVFRASSNDPAFVASYETPGTESPETARIRQSVAGLVLDFLKQNKIAVLTLKDMALVEPNAEKRLKAFKNANLVPVEQDLDAFLKAQGKPGVASSSIAEQANAALTEPDVDGDDVSSSAVAEALRGEIKTQEKLLALEPIAKTIHSGEFSDGRGYSTQLFQNPSEDKYTLVQVYQEAGDLIDFRFFEGDMSSFSAEMLKNRFDAVVSSASSGVILTTIAKNKLEEIRKGLKIGDPVAKFLDEATVLKALNQIAEDVQRRNVASGYKIVADVRFHTRNPNPVIQKALTLIAENLFSMRQENNYFVLRVEQDVSRKGRNANYLEFLSKMLSAGYIAPSLGRVAEALANANSVRFDEEIMPTSAAILIRQAGVLKKNEGQVPLSAVLTFARNIRGVQDSSRYSLSTLSFALERLDAWIVRLKSDDTLRAEFPKLPSELGRLRASLSNTISIRQQTEDLLFDDAKKLAIALEWANSTQDSISSQAAVFIMQQAALNPRLDVPINVLETFAVVVAQDKEKYDEKSPLLRELIRRLIPARVLYQKQAEAQRTAENAARRQREAAALKSYQDVQAKLLEDSKAVAAEILTGDHTGRLARLKDKLPDSQAQSLSEYLTDEQLVVFLALIKAKGANTVVRYDPDLDISPNDPNRDKILAARKLFAELLFMKPDGSAFTYIVPAIKVKKTDPPTKEATFNEFIRQLQDTIQYLKPNSLNKIPKTSSASSALSITIPPRNISLNKGQLRDLISQGVIKEGAEIAYLEFNDPDYVDEFGRKEPNRITMSSKPTTIKYLHYDADKKLTSITFETLPGVKVENIRIVYVPTSDRTVYKAALVKNLAEKSSFSSELLNAVTDIGSLQGLLNVLGQNPSTRVWKEGEPKIRSLNDGDVQVDQVNIKGEGNLVRIVALQKNPFTSEGNAPRTVVGPIYVRGNPKTVQDSLIAVESFRNLTDTVTIAASSGVGVAQTTPLGGIDFDPTNMNLQIKRDGKGVPLPLPQQNLDQINIQGLFPIIINIAPVNAETLPIFLGQAPKEQGKEPEPVLSQAG